MDHDKQAVILETHWDNEMRFSTRPPQYKPRPSANEEWKTYRKGLNLLLRPTELGNDELAVADNIMLTGSGVPTGLVS